MTTKAKGMSVQTVALKDIRPNPFRYITDYPLSDTKIAELVESINDTGFWTNVCARPMNGHYEIAYGHHRIEAAKRAGLKAVPLVVEDDMDDERAFAMMTRENSESYGIAAYADAGVIAGLIAGYVDGRLTLKPVHPETPTRTVYLGTREDGKLRIIGPGGKEVEEARLRHTSVTFTTFTLAEHLGWTKKGGASGQQPTDRFYAGFNALTHLILPGAVTPKDLEALPQHTVLNIAAVAKKESESVAKQRSTAAFNAAIAPTAQRRLQAEQEVERLAKEETRVRKHAAQEAIREAKSEGAKREEKQRLQRAAAQARPKHAKTLPPIERYVDDLIVICKTTNMWEPLIAKAQRLLPHLDELDDIRALALAKALREMVRTNAKRIELLADAFEAVNKRQVRKLLA